MTRRGWRGWLRAWTGMLLLAMALPGAGHAAARPSALQASTLETLLSPDADSAARKQGLQALVASAQGGNGWSAYVLGALYRSGRDHPARLVDRDPDTARHWFIRCVESAGCPLLALASLAELELAEGNPEPAMQWAQAWVALDREFTRQVGEPDRSSPTSLRALTQTSYHAYLVERCYALMPGPEGDKDRRGRAWFDALRVQRGKALDRMLFAAVDARSALPGGTDDGLRPMSENQRRRTLDPRAAVARQPALGVYLYRGNPRGGQAESVQTIEALPNPMQSFGLKALARETRMTGYDAPAGERRYVVLPLALGRTDYYLFEPRR